MVNLTIPEAILRSMEGIESNPAGEDEIAAIETLAGGPLPEDYRAFIARFGFPSWPETAPAEFPTGKLLGDIDTFHNSWHMSNILDNDPLAPQTSLLPIAGAYDGHGMIFLEIAPSVGQIWFGEYVEDCIPVATSFTDFLALLKYPEAEEPAAVQRSTGEQEVDPRTGFVIARETRAAWQKYGVGDDPESEANISAVETRLGHTLPSQLRAFLKTYGCVDYFGEAIPNLFDLPLEAARRRDKVSVIYAAEYLLRHAKPEARFLPFALAGRDAEILIGLEGETVGNIFWQETPDTAAVFVAHSLADFLACLYCETPIP